jgi:hypothetical protein
MFNNLIYIGGGDMDMIVGDDLIVDTIAPVFLSNSGGAIGSSNDSAIIDTYHILRDIEIAAMYFDSSLFVSQQSLMASRQTYYLAQQISNNPICDTMWIWFN